MWSSGRGPPFLLGPPPAPWWVPALLATRGFQGPVEAVLGRNRALREALKEDPG